MKKTIKTIITLFLILLIVFVAGFLFYLNMMVKSPAGSKEDDQIFEVKNGESTFQIAEKLKENELIKSDWIFVLNAKIKAKPLQTGYYSLSSNLTMVEIYEKLSSGDTNITKITIPEGYRVEQIAQILDEKKISSYDSFVSKAKPYEGKLFPDTYFLPAKFSDDQIITMMVDNFNERTKELKVANEDLIIASIVEREAIKDEERPLIAGIYKNRLAKKMKLEADPTVQYGKDSLELRELTVLEQKEFKFWKPISTADYKSVDSPYNAYLIPSLPPGPICNPGIKSIKAAINYSKHNYLYFLQNDGKIYPAETLQQHDKNRVNILGVN